MPFVLDNSVTSGWYIKEQETPYSNAILDRLQYDEAYAPVLGEPELANVLRTSVIRGKFTEDQATSAATFLGGLPISIDRTPVAVTDLLALALRYNLSSYDAAYLELAIRLRIPIAARDGALKQAAEASGVGIIVPM